MLDAIVTEETWLAMAPRAARFGSCLHKKMSRLPARRGPCIEVSLVDRDLCAYDSAREAMGEWLQQGLDRCGNPLRIEPLIAHLLPLAAVAFLVGADVLIFPFKACLK